MLRGEPLRNVLHVDLSRRRWWVEERPALFADALGGSAVGIRLLSETCPEGVEPTAAENPIVFSVGPLTGLFPMASKTVAMFKSPHTGELGESHAGGRSAVAIRLAGYGAIVIRGASSIPVYLVIDGDGVRFRDAAALWGMRSSYTVGDILRERESGSGYRTIMRIGRAGERGVSYACVITETYRHFGRLGLGAVFGSKQLKGVVVVGDRSLRVADQRAYRDVYDQIFDTATKSELMKKYHELGTAMNVLPLDEMGALPTRNLQQAHFPHAGRLSGEHMAEEYLGRRLACAHCPVACIHLAALRTPHPDEPYFCKTSMLGYDYEPIYALGSMIGGADTKGMLRLMDEVEVQGLDAMSTGVVLAWATEALERGLVSEQDTDGVSLSWGDYDAYIAATRRIVTQPTPFYRALAQGVDQAASEYGGEDFALSFGGQEMAGYHTGPGAYLTYLTGARHSHLDSAGYGLDQQEVREAKSMDPGSVADALLEEERWRQVLSSLVICFFARGVYTPEIILRALASAGFDRSEQDLRDLGTETLRRKVAFKKREGFAYETLRIPRRIMETMSPLGTIDEGFLRRAIRHYAEGV